VSRDLDALTEREYEVLQLVLRGRSNAQIGDLLFISDGTVRHHITSIYAKFGMTGAPGCRPRGVLAVEALRRGLVSATTPDAALLVNIAFALVVAADDITVSDAPVEATVVQGPIHQAPWQWSRSPTMLVLVCLVVGVLAGIATVVLI
jgi:DNA-binding CsgD family transcriptional regulator